MGDRKPGLSIESFTLEVCCVLEVSLWSLTLLCPLPLQEDFRDKVDEYIKRYAR